MNNNECPPFISLFFSVNFLSSFGEGRYLSSCKRSTVMFSTQSEHICFAVVPSIIYILPAIGTFLLHFCNLNLFIVSGVMHQIRVREMVLMI